MKTKVLLTSGLFFFCVIFTTCDNFATINQVVGGRLRVAVRVGNGAAGRSVIGPGDTIELYIRWLGFRGSPHEGYGPDGPWNYMNVVFASGYHTNPGESGPRFDQGNEKWHNPNSPFTRLYNSFLPNDTFDRIELRILAMRIGDREYPFPSHLSEIVYGQGGEFPFVPITLDDTVKGFIARLTVDPEILLCWEEDGTWGSSTVDHEYMLDENRKPPGYIHTLKPGGENPYSFITITGEFTY